MTNLARFKIQASPSTDRGFDVTIDGPLSLQLEASSSLIRTVEYAVYDAAEPGSPLASLAAPALLLNNGAGSSGLRVAASAPTSIVALGLATGVFTGLTDASSWKVRCIVNGGIDSATNKPSPDLIFERIIAKRDSSGNRRIIPGEQTEYSARGWVDSIVPGPTGPTGPGYAGIQSTTSLNASTASGSTSLTVNLTATAHAFRSGDRVRISSRATPTDWCAGTVTAATAFTLTVTIDTNGGANTTHTDWNVGLLGTTGIGYAGLQSATSLNASTVSPTASLTTNLQATQTAFAVGDRIKLSSRATPGDWCAGVIASFSGTSMAVTVDTNAGANAAHTDWNVAISGDLPIPAPGATGGVLQSNGTSWKRQTFFRTPGAAALAGASGFVRAAGGETVVSANLGGSDYDVLSVETAGNGYDPVLGSLSLYRTTIRASTIIKLNAGSATVQLTASGLNTYNLPVTGIPAPSAASDAVHLAWVDPVADSALTLDTCANLLHLHFDGAAWTDSGAAAQTITASGSPTRDTTTKKFGASALYTAGSASNYITITNAAVFPEWGDFTIEFWFYLTSGTGYSMWFAGTNAALNDCIGPLIMVDSGNSKPVFAWSVAAGQGAWSGSIAANSTTTVIGLNAWKHIAIDRTDGLVRMYIEGVPQTATAIVPYMYAGDRFRMGAHAGSGMNGYVDETRITGFARYKGATFTPSAAAFADYSAPASPHNGQIRMGARGQNFQYVNGLWRPMQH